MSVSGEWVLNFDGCAEPNPGLATFGWVLTENGVIHRTGHGLASESGTNNVAEYAALEAGLSAVRVYQAGTLEVRGDSQLVVKQVNGEWKCKAAHLAECRDRCLTIIREMEARGWRVRVKWTPREDNDFADRLSKLAWETVSGKPFVSRYQPA